MASPVCESIINDPGYRWFIIETGPFIDGYHFPKKRLKPVLAIYRIYVISDRKNFGALLMHSNLISLLGIFTKNTLCAHSFINMHAIADSPEEEKLCVANDEKCEDNGFHSPSCYKRAQSIPNTVQVLNKVESACHLICERCLLSKLDKDNIFDIKCKKCSRMISFPNLIEYIKNKALYDLKSGNNNDLKPGNNNDQKSVQNNDQKPVQNKNKKSAKRKNKKSARNKNQRFVKSESKKPDVSESEVESESENAIVSGYPDPDANLNKEYNYLACKLLSELLFAFGPYTILYSLGYHNRNDLVVFKEYCERISVLVPSRSRDEDLVQQFISAMESVIGPSTNNNDWLPCIESEMLTKSSDVRTLYAHSLSFPFADAYNIDNDLYLFLASFRDEDNLSALGTTENHIHFANAKILHVLDQPFVSIEQKMICCFPYLFDIVNGNQAAPILSKKSEGPSEEAPELPGSSEEGSQDAELKEKSKTKEGRKEPSISGEVQKETAAPGGGIQKNSFVEKYIQNSRDSYDGPELDYERIFFNMTGFSFAPRSEEVLRKLIREYIRYPQCDAAKLAAFPHIKSRKFSLTRQLSNIEKIERFVSHTSIQSPEIPRRIHTCFIQLFEIELLKCKEVKYSLGDFVEMGKIIKNKAADSHLTAYLKWIMLNLITCNSVLGISDRIKRIINKAIKDNDSNSLIQVIGLYNDPLLAQPRVELFNILRALKSSSCLRTTALKEFVFHDMQADDFNLETRDEIFENPANYYAYLSSLIFYTLQNHLFSRPNTQYDLLERNSSYLKTHFKTAFKDQEKVSGRAISDIIMENEDALNAYAYARYYNFMLSDYACDRVDELQLELPEIPIHTLTHISKVLLDQMDVVIGLWQTAPILHFIISKITHDCHENGVLVAVSQYGAFNLAKNLVWHNVDPILLFSRYITTPLSSIDEYEKHLICEFFNFRYYSKKCQRLGILMHNCRPIKTTRSPRIDQAVRDAKNKYSNKGDAIEKKKSMGELKNVIEDIVDIMLQADDDTDVFYETSVGEIHITVFKIIDRAITFIENPLDQQRSRTINELMAESQ